MIRFLPQAAVSTRPFVQGRERHWDLFWTLLSLAIGSGVLFLYMQTPPRTDVDLVGGPFWALPPLAWLGVGALAGLVLWTETGMAQWTAVIMFALTTMGGLGVLEPWGVFHDSWQNVGLGQLVVTPQYVAEVRQLPYVASSPVSFVVYGLLRILFPSTPHFLQWYPTICVLLYATGVYTVATTFAEVYGEHLRRERFGRLAVFAFFALAPLFLVRVNPAPQSLAFVLMPFCLAAVLQSTVSVKARLMAITTFGLLVFTHPITAVMTLAVGTVWMLADWVLWRRYAFTPIIRPNTLGLYACLFGAWLAFVGLWIVKAGRSFGTRMLNLLNADQQATITATMSAETYDFIWVHRGALLGGALLVLIGLVWTLYRSRAAGLHLLAWSGTAVVWLPWMFLGEFGDRGPLFAALPSTLAVGFTLYTAQGRWARWPIGGLMLVTTLATYTTAYANHVGEIISEAEVQAFAAIAEANPDRIIAYAYVPPLSGAQLTAYSRQRIRAYATTAADFSYERLAKANYVIVISDQMRAAARQRGPKAVQSLAKFEAQLRQQPQQELIFDNGKVQAFRAR